MNKTGFFTHPDCKGHEIGRGHPECPERLDAIEDRLLVSGVGDALERREAPLAATAHFVGFAVWVSKKSGLVHVGCQSVIFSVNV